MTVFAILPVFNRLALTQRCVRLLLAQRYSPIEIVVADGGSSDGTPEAIRGEFPGVTVLTSKRELWWTGAMAMGIEHALRASRDADDLVLMMNNDTEFDAGYVETLAQESLGRGAAVGALTVDSEDPSKILDAGEFIDWEKYDFPVKTHVAPGETWFDGVDVLPGRGSIVPLRMIREVGNVDHRRFPHYVADYEFFCRVKRHGFPLGVTYRTRLRSHSDVTGLAARAGEKRSLITTLHLLTSRRSMNNFIDHYRFIDRCAPAEARRRVKLRFVGGYAMRALERLGVLRVLRWCYEAYTAFFPPYYADESDVAAAGLTPGELLTGRHARRLRLGERDVYVLRLRMDRKCDIADRVARLHGLARERGQRWPRFTRTKMLEN